MLLKLDRAIKLRKLVGLVDDASNTIIDEWEKTPEAEPAPHGGVTLPREPLLQCAAEQSREQLQS